MSKLQLKKELSHLEASQLREIILDLYSARPEVKQYFDFYLNPDVKKLTDKYLEKVNKELLRQKWGRSKARISNIRKLIKEFASYSPGFEAVGEFTLSVIAKIIAVDSYLFIPSTISLGLDSLTVAYLDHYNDNLMLDTALARLGNLLNREEIGRQSTRRSLMSLAQQYLVEKQNT